jgi:hypothetical protein
MSIPQHITYEKATTVEINIPTPPSSTQTVSLYTGDGAAIFEDQSATASTISTTLSAGAAVGATSIAVTSATGITPGRRFNVGTAATEQVEECRCESISGTTVTLWTKLLFAHASGATVKGTRLTYSVSAANAATLFWDGRLEWTVDTSTLYVQAACCTKYPFRTNMATKQDLLDENPHTPDLLDADMDPQRLVIKGAEDVIKRVAALTNGRAHSFIGSVQFTDAVVYAAWMRYYRRLPGEEAERLYERYSATLASELETLMAGVTYRDADQDGVVEEAEQRSYRSRRLFRA